MCGRFTQTKNREEVLAELGRIELPPLFYRRFNIAPTQPLGIIRQNLPNQIHTATWGFENPHNSGLIINARSETLQERTMFKRLVSGNRCIIPADGFYEWKGRQPYYFQLADKAIFAFAGLWLNEQFVIVTRAADETMQGIHNRMPVILPWQEQQQWLDAFLIPEAPRLICRPVSRRVNAVKNDDSSCLDSADVQTDLSLFPEED
jgi:putative SOS response-associated peptidase YedK